jgi:hypothetical protein
MKKNLIEAFVEYLQRLFYLFGLVLIGGVASGCATKPVEPIVIVKHVAVAPPDNLIVDCDIAVPPEKMVYLRRNDVGMALPDLSIASEPYPYTAKYVQALMRISQDREGLLEMLIMKHYQNTDACNRRLKQLREWKAKSLLELETNKKE